MVIRVRVTIVNHLNLGLCFQSLKRNIHYKSQGPNQEVQFLIIMTLNKYSIRIKSNS